MKTKSAVAFILSAEKLFEVEDKLYFWTFTFVDVLNDWDYSRTWGAFIKALCNLYGGTLRGLKVVEFHKRHGAHYHALVNKRIYAGRVRRLASRYGIGRVHVKMADGGATEYLSKYLGKDFKRRNQAFARMCRWGTIGAFSGTRIRDLEVISNFNRAVGTCRTAVGVVRWGSISQDVIAGLKGVPCYDGDTVLGVAVALRTEEPSYVFSKSLATWETWGRVAAIGAGRPF
jgi:hypothetical protein